MMERCRSGTADEAGRFISRAEHPDENAAHHDNPMQMQQRHVDGAGTVYLMG
jgi:hypothetical protein